MRNPEDKLDSVLRESTRNLIQHLTAIHGYLQLLQAEEMSPSARELLRKLIEHDQRACAMLETLIGLEHSQKNIASTSAAIAATEPPRRALSVPAPSPPARQSGRVLLVGNDSAALDFQRSVFFHLGGNVAQETNFENLRNLLGSQEFELILIDESSMPGSQVEDFHLWLSTKRPQLRERLVFLVSASKENEFEKVGFRTLKKPLQLPELIQCSREFLPFSALPIPTGQGRVH